MTPDHIQTIFEELKTNGLICKSRHLIPKIKEPNFRASAVCRTKIFYNPDLSTMNDDSIRFSLLHEEGHKINKQFSHKLLILCAIISILTILIIFYLSSDMDIILRYLTSIGACLFIILIIIILFNVFKFRIYKDEHASDLFAAINLKNYYGYFNIYKIIDVALNEINYGRHKSTVLGNIINNLIPTHPSDEDRVSRVKNEVDRLE